MPQDACTCHRSNSYNVGNYSGKRRTPSRRDEEPQGWFGLVPRRRSRWLNKISSKFACYMWEGYRRHKFLCFCWTKSFGQKHLLDRNTFWTETKAQKASRVQAGLCGFG